MDPAGRRPKNQVIIISKISNNSDGLNDRVLENIQWISEFMLNQPRELLALKRIGPIRGSTTANVVLVPESSGDQDLCIYLLSDAYLGIDQQYDMHLHVEEEEGAKEGEELIYYSDEEERPWEEQVEESYPSK